MNQTQGPTVATISAEPKTQDVDVAIFTHRGAMMGDDGTQSQVQLDGKKKVDFGSLVGSTADSQPSSEAELGFGPSFVTGSGHVVDFESTIGLDFATAECSWFSIS